MNNSKSPKANPVIETLDREKLIAIINKNWFWIFLIIILSNLASYLILRYTKDRFQAKSELKLDIQSNTTELGINTFVQDENLNLLSGEIEQIKSPLFLSRVIDSLDLWVSYYSVGKVLNDEMYRRSPFKVIYSNADNIVNIPVYFNYTKDGYTLKISGEEPINGNFDKPIIIRGAKLFISQNPGGSRNTDDEYYFTINSGNYLLNFVTTNLTVEPINFNAKTIRISFQDFNAFKTQAIVNAIDSLYLLYSFEQKNIASIQKVSWLNQELGGLEDKMGDYEGYFKSFTIENKSSDLKIELKNTIIDINKLDSQSYFLSRRISSLKDLIDKISINQDYSGSIGFLPDNLIKQSEFIKTKEKEIDKLGLSYNESTFAYKQASQELNNLKADFFSELTNLKSSWMLQLSEINKNKNSLERKFKSIPDKTTEFDKNQRYYKLYEEFYLSLMQSKAGFELAQAGSTPNFKILSSASVPTEPISPKRKLIYAVGAVGGIVISFFLIGFLYVINDKITSVREIERTLDIPVIGQLPANTIGPKVSFFVVDHPKSRLSEAFRNLRSSLDFLNPAQKLKVVAISSSISGEGKSFVAQNLSCVLALSKKRVVLLDLDMRKPTRALPFKIQSPDKGVSTILIGRDKWQDCISPTHIENLDYIPNGPLPPNPAELLINGEFETLLSELKGHYDFLVLDTPPAGLVTDGVMALKKADISIFMFRCNYSRKENLAGLNRMINIHKLSNIAVVFNDFIPPSDNGYGYYEETKTRKKFLKFFKS